MPPEIKAQSRALKAVFTIGPPTTVPASIGICTCTGACGSLKDSLRLVKMGYVVSKRKQNEYKRKEIMKCFIGQKSA